jgi:hypothetical protein
MRKLVSAVMKIKPWPIKVVFSIAGILIVLVSIPLTVVLVEQAKYPLTKSSAATTWAFEETFDYGAPTSPSQTLLPKTLDYNVTHRISPQDTDGYESSGSFGTFNADHGADCSGPPNQHTTSTTHRSDGTNIDKSFYLCNDHIMTAMGLPGANSAYSVASFWPKQEFNFAAGGDLEFDTGVYSTGSRNWYEIMIVPRNQMKVSAAKEQFPIDETYSKHRIVLTYWWDAKREIEVGRGTAEGDAGQDYQIKDGAPWNYRNPGDPAFTDRKIRRQQKVNITNTKITWSIQKADGTFDTISLDTPGGLGFSQGLVLFKTHAYDPEKDGNSTLLSWHWDNIRFSGPKLTPYQTFESSAVVKMEQNGSVPIGSTQTQTINLPSVGQNPVIFGQVHKPLAGQVLLSVNDNPNISVSPIQTMPCEAEHWLSFRIPNNQLKTGVNTFKWTVGPKPSCSASWSWNGFTIKSLEVQFDGVGGTTPPPPPTTKVGDLNNDNLVNILDLSILLSKFNTTDVAADLNKDGKVDLLDLSVLLSKWGS